jgi:hypothetical protein
MAHNSELGKDVAEEGTDEGDQYRTVSPEGWVISTDLAAQSIMALYRTSQSMPKMTSRSVDLRAMRETG